MIQQVMQHEQIKKLHQIIIVTYKYKQKLNLADYDDDKEDTPPLRSAKIFETKAKHEILKEISRLYKEKSLHV